MTGTRKRQRIRASARQARMLERAGSAMHPAFDRDEQFHKRRQALLQAAIHLFNRHGYHATSIEAIAAAVGLTKGTLYH